MKILIIEDDPGSAEFIRLAVQLGFPGVELYTAQSGGEGIDLFGQNNPDVVLVDLRLPDIHGFDVVKQIRSSSSVPIVILSVIGDEEAVSRGLDSGADAYMIKPLKQAELIGRIKALFRKTSSESTEQSLRFGMLRLNVEDRSLAYADKEVFLTDIETRIMKLLIERQGLLAGYEDLSREIWGSTNPKSPNALKVHIRHLREKLETDPDNPKLIQNQFGQGYYLVKPQQYLRP
ncbi:two-component system, OmpR family, KDP operon response regulator KdpE [Dehalogenimonas formicexedens]|uniref:Two-component system, OmpR family, KDP operon response regulator KdpE n=1 Tax=Dehalogenimonas formicexedens TaxID=1839801 RepID=A0A1P8F5J0_9CHLR|nr:response regulator transcription factor [Dehalogenimonas formicexedens]APV43698.1 two-component system, OmpR family, KDP operon response regulator KdpE [Dehalogenimonas formicexedens]